MPHVAFLRAINVGGHTVKMDRLRALFEEAGMRDVATFIASGNVIFEAEGKARALERKLEAHLEEALGYPVGVFIRSPEELAHVATFPAFDAEQVEGAVSRYVAFLGSAPASDVVKAVQEFSTENHLLRIDGRELYWLGNTLLSQSDVDDRALGKALGTPMTMRNLNTVRRILAKVT